MKNFQKLCRRADGMLLSALLIAGSLGAIPPTIASAASNLAFRPVADAYVSANKPGVNYGKSSSLRADAFPSAQSYLRFNVKALGSSHVQGAWLRMYSRSSSSSGLRVRTVPTNAWRELSVTFKNRPSLGILVAGSRAVSSGEWVVINVTSRVRAAGTYSFGIVTPGSAAISLASRESGATAPRLIIKLAGPTPPLPTGGIKHVFIVVMENHGYNKVWNTNSSSYITQLGNSFARATNYKATDHPSLPNYLQLYTGSNYGINSDCSPSSSCHINAHNLADSLEAKGLTWKGYMESMPAPCYIKSSSGYAPKHDPFVYFDDIRNNARRCATHVVPFKALTADLRLAATTPNYSMIVPNQCNDMHDCSVSTGDNWLKSHIPAILNSPACKLQKCLVVITWDEDDGSQGNHVLTIFAGSGAKTGGATSSVSYTHYSLLRTVEKIFGVATQSNRDGSASAMNDLLR
ncbi:MAG: alkaline phosphatase family protein [Anaerolineales bacterium]